MDKKQIALAIGCVASVGLSAFALFDARMTRKHARIAFTDFGDVIDGLVQRHVDEIFEDIAEHYED